MHPFLEHGGPLAIVHRGGGEAAAENSMEAFQAAWNLGFRWFETDVRATSDGHLVLAHDGAMARGHGGSRKVGALSAAECTRAGIPSLAKLLHAFPFARVNIDPKTDAAAHLLPNELSGAIDRVCVGCFSDSRIRWLRDKMGKGICTALSPREVLALRLGKLRETGACCAQVPLRWWGIPVVDARFIRAAHALGLAVHVWTINGEAQMNRLLDMGVDGIMTDAPDVLKKVFAERKFPL